MLTSMKLKLQLFPIDDITRRALEMVSTKKKLSLIWYEALAAE